MQSLCGMDRVRRAIATLGAMLGRAVFGGIGDAAREERLAPAREILRFGQARQDRNRRTVEMGLCEIDADIGDAEIGRASCRERVCPYVSISVVAVSLKKKIK